MRITCTVCILSVFICVSSLRAQDPLSRDSVAFDTAHHVSGDSTKDSLVVDFKDGKFHFRHRRLARNFLITEPPEGRINRFIEPYTLIDFNRVTGFFLGMGSSRYFDIGRYDEIGIKGGIGYGFEKHKGQSFLGAEYRIPLRSLNMGSDSILGRTKFTSVPTLAIGGEYHNLTTTEDQWRMGRLENAFDAFFAREDFRDYFKIEGFYGHIAFRPTPHWEGRFEYRNDVYSSEEQRVFYGRFGGNKRLPVNPSIIKGRFESFVLSAVNEHTKTDFEKATTIFGDSVEIETLSGTSYFLQLEISEHLDYKEQYNKFTLDIRRFQPIVNGLNIDSRLRIEQTASRAPIQKLSFLGGPSTLPAYKNKVFFGDNMLLLNTEVRLNLAMISTIFEHSGTQLIIKNDFGYIKPESSFNIETSLPVHGKFTISDILYNPGIGIGSVSGMELGVSFRTDIHESPRFFFRFERPF